MHVYGIYYIFAACLNCADCSPFLKGSTALKRYPTYRSDVERVLVDGFFELHDLVWISRSIGGAVRLTMDAATYSEITKSRPELQPDSRFGSGPFKAHLYFKWEKSLDGTGKIFGHYNAMSPKRGVFSVPLDPDASWPELICVLLGGC